MPKRLPDPPRSDGPSRALQRVPDPNRQYSMLGQVLVARLRESQRHKISSHTLRASPPRHQDHGKAPVQKRKGSTATRSPPHPLLPRGLQSHFPGLPNQPTHRGTHLHAYTPDHSSLASAICFSEGGRLVDFHASETTLQPQPVANQEYEHVISLPLDQSSTIRGGWVVMPHWIESQPCHTCE